MKINELEKTLSVTRANIRFYEKEGLIHPERKENGYRDYSDEDVSRLKEIIIFRKLGIPIPDIKDVLEGKRDLQTILDENSKRLEKQIEELNGALSVCRRMQKDNISAERFDGDYYWNVIREDEKQGLKFMDYLQDYAQFEKGLFMYTLGAFSGDKKARNVLLIVVCASIIRGLFCEFIGDGSFLGGFLYPFSIFLLISLGALPIYIISKKYANIELDEKEKKHKYLSTPSTLLVLIIWLVIMIFGEGILLEDVIYSRIWKNELYCVFHTKLNVAYFVVSTMVFVIIVFLFRRKGIGGNVFDGDEVGIVCNLPWKVRWKLFGFTMLIWLLVLLTDIATYECFSMDGIKTRFLFWEQTYTWDDVKTYEIKSGFDDTLQFSIITNDGRKYTVMGGMIGMFCEERSEGMEDYDCENYMKDVVKILHEQGKDPEINWEKVEDDMMEYWAEYTEELHQLVK